MASVNHYVVSHYVVQNRIDKRYIAGTGETGEPFRMVADIDKATRCPDELAAEQLARGYRQHCRQEGRRTIPGRDTLAIVSVGKGPEPKTWWERL